MVWRLWHACLACVLGFALTSHSRAADPVESPVRINITEALALAEQHNPAIKASRLGAVGFVGRREQAALRPPSELSLEVENFLGSGSLNGLEGAEITLTLSRLIELGDKRDHRVGVVDTQLALQQSELGRQWMELAAEVLERFVQVAADQSRLELAKREQALTQHTLDVVGERVDAALAPKAEQHRARAAFETARTQAELARLSQARSMAWLASLWGDPTPDYLGVVADLYDLPELISLEQMTALLERSPLAGMLRSQQALREAELRLAQSQSRMDLFLSGGIRRLNELDDSALVVSLSVPLNTGKRSSGAVSAAQADLQQTKAEGEAAMTEARSLLLRYHQELTSMRVLFDSLRQRVLPELESALAGTQVAYSTGRYGFLELIDAQSRLITVQRDMIEAAEHYHELLANIERLTGEAIAKPAGNPGENS